MSIWNKLKRIINTSAIIKVSDGGELPIYQVRIDDQTTVDATPIQQFGFSSRAKIGSGAITVFPNGGDRLAIVIATENNEYEIVLEDGEVSLHNSTTNYIKMKKDNTIEVVSDKMSINGDGKQFVTHAELDTALQTFITALNTHTHISGSPGSPTAPPVAPMSLDISLSRTDTIITGG